MAAFYSIDDETAFSQDLIIENVKTIEVDLIPDVYEVSRCIEWIQANHLHRVCLQFPDSLLYCAPVVSRVIQDGLGEEVFILGDTSYGECCVDELAAEHIGADGIIHFGHSCLTSTQVLPVLLIFTRLPLAVTSLISAAKTKCDITDNILLLYDVEYHHHLENFMIIDWVGKVKVAKPSEAFLNLSNVVSESPRCDTASKFGRNFGVKELSELSEFTVIYVGKGGNVLLNFVLSLPCKQFLVFDEDKGELEPARLQLGKELMKRFYMVERAKDAARIGLLVGTLGVSRHKDMLEKLRKVVKSSGKKCYTFLIGKPNVAKLANFPEVDVFVLVSCSQTSLVDSKEFMQPVITPYELEVACRPEREWSSQYVTDFRDLLPGGGSFVEEREEVGDHEVDVSLVTGGVRRIGRRHEEVEEGALVESGDRSLSVMHKGGGGEFLASRTWSGLEQKLGQTKVVAPLIGQRGIASGYDGEPEI